MAAKRKSPTAAQIAAARQAAGHTRHEAAAVIYSTWRTWQNWEAAADEVQSRRMHPGLFELYLLKTGQA